MKREKIISGFFIFISFLAFENFSSGQSWQKLPDFPGLARDDGVSFVIGNTAYCGTGLKTGWSAGNDFYALDLISDTWSEVKSMPPNTERQYASAFSYRNRGYVFGGMGNSSNALNDLWEFNPETEEWIQKTSLPGPGLAGASCFTMNGIAYISGGKNSNAGKALNTVWAYEISKDEWTQRKNMPFAGRWRASSAEWFDKGFLIFGKDSSGKFCNELYEYDAKWDSWKQISSFPSGGRCYSSLLQSGGKLFVMAGIDSSNTNHNDFLEFDLFSGLWKEKVSLPGNPRKGGMGFFGTEGIYYSTGIDNHNVRLAETLKFFNKVNASPDYPRIFPNPTKGKLMIDLHSLTGGHPEYVANAQLYVFSFNLPGKILLQQKITEEYTSLDLTACGFRNGGYIVKIFSGKSEIFSGKVIVFR